MFGAGTTRSGRCSIAYRAFGRLLDGTSLQSLGEKDGVFFFEEALSDMTFFVFESRRHLRVLKASAFSDQQYLCDLLHIDASLKQATVDDTRVRPRISDVSKMPCERGCRSPVSRLSS